MIEFWQLPGPSRFLRGIADDLRAGCNVVLTFSEHSIDGWFTTLCAELSDSLPSPQMMVPDGNPPIVALQNHLGLQNSSPRMSLPELCRLHAFGGKLIYLDFRTPGEWLPWQKFLLDYEDACKQISLTERTLFIAGLCGEVTPLAPGPANLLHLHKLVGQLESLDIRIHAANLLAGTTLPPWQRQLAVSLLVELALWDPEVCAIGSSLPLADLIQPATWLMQLAQDRGWTATDDVKDPAALWRGHSQQFEGEIRVHSAWLAMASHNEALNQRIWNGQVAALFPLLERHRRALIKAYRGLFRLPMQTDYKLITRYEDLELNHIADQLRSMNSRGLRDTCDFVFWLRDIRNDLAHLSLVSPADLLKPQFSARMSRCPTEDF